MGRLIDADALEAYLNENIFGAAGKIKAWLDAQPIVDAVPVVRCKDCRYWRQKVSPTEHWVCAHHSFNERKMYTMPDFYCADGERREEDVERKDVVLR